MCRLTKLHTPVRDDVLLLSAAYCFSSTSVPEWVTHGRSPLGCPCPGVSLSLPASPWPGVPAQLSGARTSFACGQASPWRQGSQAGSYSCSPGRTARPSLLSLSLPPHTRTWFPAPAPAVRWPRVSPVSSSRRSGWQGGAAYVCPVLPRLQLQETPAVLPSSDSAPVSFLSKPALPIATLYFRKDLNRNGL